MAGAVVAGAVVAGAELAGAVLASAVLAGAVGDPPSVGVGDGVGDGDAAYPVLAADLTTGKVTTNWSTVQPASGTYNVAYDIWFNKKPRASGQPDCIELMVWLNHTGGVEPFGAPMTSGPAASARARRSRT